jgi:hypothetical protein
VESVIYYYHRKREEEEEEEEEMRFSVRKIWSFVFAR